jgi:hypothetical protein
MAWSASFPFPSKVPLRFFFSCFDFFNDEYERQPPGPDAKLLGLVMIFSGIVRVGTLLPRIRSKFDELDCCQILKSFKLHIPDLDMQQCHQDSGQIGNKIPPHLALLGLSYVGLRSAVR